MFRRHRAICLCKTGLCPSFMNVGPRGKKRSADIAVYMRIILVAPSLLQKWQLRTSYFSTDRYFRRLSVKYCAVARSYLKLGSPVASDKTGLTIVILFRIFSLRIDHKIFTTCFRANTSFGLATEGRLLTTQRLTWRNVKRPGRHVKYMKSRRLHLLLCSRFISIVIDVFPPYSKTKRGQLRQPNLFYRR